MLVEPRAYQPLLARAMQRLVLERFELIALTIGIEGVAKRKVSA